jgi:hypothetical protein
LCVCLHRCMLRCPVLDQNNSWSSLGKRSVLLLRGSKNTLEANSPSSPSSSSLYSRLSSACRSFSQSFSQSFSMTTTRTNNTGTGCGSQQELGGSSPGFGSGCLPSLDSLRSSTRNYPECKEPSPLSSSVRDCSSSTWESESSPPSAFLSSARCRESSASSMDLSVWSTESDSPSGIEHEETLLMVMQRPAGARKRKLRR